MPKIILCLLTLFCLSAATAQPPEHIVFFGDSLSDNGNMYHLNLHWFPKSPPYYHGRFSNGPTWAENIGQYYQEHYKTTYTVYAMGGATALSHLLPTTHLIITLTHELDRYLLDTLFRDKSKTLFAIWIGGNDYLDDTSHDVDGLTTRVVNAIEETITTLMSHHAKQFLVLSLADLSKLPLASIPSYDAQHLHQLTIAHNRKLDITMRELQQKHPEITLVYVDIGYYFDDLQHDPEKYNQNRHVNIKDTSHSCWEGGYTLNAESSGYLAFDRPLSVDADTFHDVLATHDLAEALQVDQLALAHYTPCPHPEEYIFWDKIHPTALAHTLIALRVKEALGAAGLGW